jgi:hypothetical protein
MHDFSNSRQRRPFAPGGVLAVLLGLALSSTLLYVGPMYPATVQQLHLHLRLPQSASGNVELRLDNGGLLAESSIHSTVVAGPTSLSTAHTLSVKMCEGFAHQRADILAGLVLAVELNRTLVLPRLLLDGGRSAASTDGFVELVDFGWVWCSIPCCLPSETCVMSQTSLLDRVPLVVSAVKSMMSKCSSRLCVLAVSVLRSVDH